MTEHDLEQSLHAGYREMVDREASETLRARVSTIPDLPTDQRPALMGRMVPFALTASAAAVALMIGIGLLVRELPDVGPSVPGSEASVGSDGFVSLLRSTVQYDYDVHESPQDLRDDSNLVVVGRFASVTQGRTIEGIGPHATLTIDVEQTLVGSAESVVNGQIFLELVTSAGGSVADYRERLPAGRVLLFLDDRSDIEGKGPTGAPDGAPIFALASPLGLILEDGGQLVGGYEDLGGAPPAWAEETTFDAFVAALEP
jgi:hypothetical protein